MAHLSNEDWITSTHRGHGHLIAKGGEYGPMFAELFGRERLDTARGKAEACTSPIWTWGCWGANGIVGAGPPIGVGAAFSIKYRKTQNVAVTFFGDGASNEGRFTRARTWRPCTSCP